MTNHIAIQPIQIGDLQEKQANGITWQVNGIMRGATDALANCTLIWVYPDGGTAYVMSFQVNIDNETLQAWGEDDTIIDDKVLAFSPLFVRA
jgi:hypothetical protein